MADDGAPSGAAPAEAVSPAEDAPSGGMKSEEGKEEEEEEEDGSTRDALLALLREREVSFEHSVHAATRTSAESAAVRGTTLASGAKAILMNFKPAPSQLTAEEKEARGAGTWPGRFALLVMAADRGLDSKAAKKLLGNPRSMCFAKVDDVARLTRCIPGAVPPFGSLFGLQTFMDESLQAVPRIDFNCGLRTESVHLDLKDYLDVEKPTVGSFTSALSS